MLPRVSYCGVLALVFLSPILELVFAVFRHRSLARNLEHYGRECVLICLVAEEHDLPTRRPVGHAGVKLVTMVARREKSVAGRKEENPIAFAAFAEVETTGAFEVRIGLGCDWKTERGSEWATYVGGCVGAAAVVEELQTSGPGEDGLAECNLDAGDLRLREDILAAIGHFLSLPAGECPGHYAHPKGQWTGFISDLGKADRVNAGLPEVNGVKVFILST